MEEENGHLLRDQQSPCPLFLDLTLSRKDHHSECGPNNPELNLINGFEIDSNPNNTDNRTPEHRVFSCNYCQRQFYSSQALGGHQNAHKRERTLAKRVNSHSNGGYSSIASLPLHGSFNHMRSLGIQAHSMIHKPILWTNSRQLAPFDHHQPAIGRLVQQESNVHSVGIGQFQVVRAPRFDAFRSFSPASASEEIHGGKLWWGGMKSKPDEIHNKLDLSLKL